LISASSLIDMPLAPLFNLQWYGPCSSAARLNGVASVTAQPVGSIRSASSITGAGAITFARSLRLIGTTANITGTGAITAAQPRGTIRCRVVIKVNELSQDDVTGAVWQAQVEPGKSYQDAILELLAGGGGGGGGLTVSQDARLTRIEKILRNKMITDPATGTMRLYDDDGTTLLLEADVFQDADGTTPYQGQGAERRERLE
jgi:hypothetical protein